MNMREKIRKMSFPGSLFLLFVLLTLLSGSQLGLLGQDPSNTYHRAVGYSVQIGLVLSGVFLLIRLLNVIVWDSIVTKILHAPVPKLAKNLSTIFIILIGMAIIVGFIFGKSVIGIWTTSSVIGVVLGFALRSLILDVFTGIAINVDDSYKIGDWVHIHARNRVEYIGCILEINWRTTRIRTTENNITVFPNSIIGQSVVTNFSVPELLSRFELSFHLDFSIPSERCLRVLLAGAKQAIGEQGIESDPAPKVKVDQVTDMGVEYMVRYWIYPAKTSPSRARHLVTSNILHNLRIAGISLAYPKRDVFHAPLPARELDVKSQQDRVAILSAIDLFSEIKSESLRVLAENVELIAFDVGETVLEANDEGNSMFVVIEGLLDVFFCDESNQQEVQVNSLCAGQFFGEMSLLTGELRTATVVASTDVVAYEITYENMRELFHYDPDVLELISQVIAERHTQIKELLATTGKIVLTEDTEDATNEILTRIKRFFGLVKIR